MSSEPLGANNSDEWWPEGLPVWIREQAVDDPLFGALDKGLRSFGWPAYNVPHPLPMEDSWPGIALALAQRIREWESLSTRRGIGAGRFVLLHAEDGEWGYVTSWDTWAEAEAAFPIASGFKLHDGETGREWLANAPHVWEAAQT